MPALRDADLLSFADSGKIIMLRVELKNEESEQLWNMKNT